MTTLPKVEDTVIVDNVRRRIVDIATNKNGEAVIVWQSKQQEGACIPGIWLEWEQHNTEDYRRETSCNK